MLDAYEVGVVLTLKDQLSATLLSVSDRFVGLNRHIGTTRKELKALEADMARIKLGLLAGGALTAISVGGLSLMKGPLEQAKAFQQEVTRFRALGLGDAMTTEATKFARSMDVIGTSATENLKLVREATTITNSLKDAEVLAPIMAKMRFGINSVMSDGKGQDFGDQLQAALKTTELRGALINRATGEVDPQEAGRVLSGLTQAYIASGGLVKPSDYLAAIKTGGVSAKLMSDEMFMFGLGHFMQESGGSRIGTASMSMFQAMAMGRMTQQAAEVWAKYGLLDPKAIHYGKTGHITKVDPMAAIQADHAVANPFDYINTVIAPTLQKQGLKGNRLNIALAELFHVRTASNLADQFVREQQVANRYIERAKGAANIDTLAGLGSKTMQGQQIDLQARWDNLMLELGNTVLPLATDALEKFTAALKGMTEAAKDHPTIAKGLEWGALGALGLGAVGGLWSLGKTGVGAIGTMLRFLGGGSATEGASAAAGGLSRALGLGSLGRFVGAVGPLAWTADTIWTSLKDWWAITDPSRQGSPNTRGVIDRPGARPALELTVPITVNIDGERVTRVVTKHQANAMGRPLASSSFFDDMQGLQPPLLSR